MSADSRLRRVAQGLVVALFWLGVWWLAAAAVNQVLLIPGPCQVAKALWQSVQTAVFWQSVGLSLLRIAVGFLSAVAVGTLLAALTARFRWLHALFSPLLHIVRAAPVASFIILALVWIATDGVPIFISFLTVLPMVWVTVEEGIRQIDPQLREIALVYRLGRRQTLTKLAAPSVLPFFLTGCVNGLGFAWKSGVAAEVICRPALSIGRQLQAAKLTLDTPEVFAWTAVVVALSILLEKVLLRVTDFAARRVPKEEPHGNA